MSYILDALKKADAQRERDPARGIHAQPGQVSGSGRQRDGAGPSFWVAGAGAVVALAAAGWYLAQDRPAVVPPPARSEAAASVAAVAPGPAIPAPVAPAAPQPPAQVVAVAPAPAAATAVLPPPAPPRERVLDPRNTSQPMMRGRLPAGGAPAGAPGTAPGGGAIPTPGAAAPAAGDAAGAPTAVAQGSALRGGATAAAPPAAPRASAAPPSTGTAAPATPAAPARAVPPARAAAPATTPEAAPVSGLPADAPKLAISGGVYSTNRAQRMLIVNGLVVNEGADLGSGVVLEEIRPKAAVLSFRGGRYTVGF